MDNYSDNSYYEEQYKSFALLKEKAAISRAAWAIAIPAVVFFLVTQFWSSIVAFVGQSFGFDKSQIAAFVNEPARLQIVQVALSLLLLTVPFVICAKIAGAGISDITVLKKPKSENNFAYLLFGIGFCAFANVAVSAAARLFESFGFNYSVPAAKHPEGVFGFLLMVLSTAIVPALVEEFAYRGIVFGLLKPFGEVFAIFASSVAFGVLHGNFEQMPFAFLVGLVLGLIRVKTDSILICMAVHAINNLVAVLLEYSTSLPRAIANITYTVYIMLALTLTILGVAFLKRNDNFKFNSPDTVNPTKKIYFTFFFSPATIVFFALFIFRAVMYIF